MLRYFAVVVFLLSSLIQADEIHPRTRHQLLVLQRVLIQQDLLYQRNPRTIERQYITGLLSSISSTVDTYLIKTDQSVLYAAAAGLSLIPENESLPQVLNIRGPFPARDLVENLQKVSYQHDAEFLILWKLNSMTENLASELDAPAWNYLDSLVKHAEHPRTRTMAAIVLLNAGDANFDTFTAVINNLDLGLRELGLKAIDNKLYSLGRNRDTYLENYLSQNPKMREKVIPAVSHCDFALKILL
jgi:hypothetical protein